MKKLSEMDESLKKKLSDLDEKIAKDSRLMQLYRSNPKQFIEELNLTPEEKGMFKAKVEDQLTSRCSCCAVFFGSCGVGCDPQVTGNGVG